MRRECVRFPFLPCPLGWKFKSFVLWGRKARAIAPIGLYIRPGTVIRSANAELSIWCRLGRPIGRIGFSGNTPRPCFLLIAGWRSIKSANLVAGAEMHRSDLAQAPAKKYHFIFTSKSSTTGSKIPYCLGI